MNDVNLRHLDLLLKHYQINQHCSVVLDDLESVLCTSRRNVSIVMRKLSHLGWVIWQPAIGRSKSSQLVIKKSLQQALTEVLLHELELGRFKLIAKLLDVYGETAVRALSVATEELSITNEKRNSVLISSYPWVNTVDPVKTYRLSELQVIKSVYDALIKQDAAGNLIPSLAHSWEVNDNVITLWLMPRVYRHDGELLHIDDVIWSIERLRDQNGPVSGLGQSIKRVDVVAENCIEITLHYPNKLFPYVLAMPNASIICRDQKSFGNYTSHIGTGPFKIEDWNSSGLRLRAHSQYFSTCALLESVTLSHETEVLENIVSFNQEVGEVNIEWISSFSYLTYRQRPDAKVSPETWQELAKFISHEKYDYDAKGAVEGIEFKQNTALHGRYPKPNLHGKITVAEPIWTIPSLIRQVKWLHRLIRSTGLELEIVVIEDISRPESVSEVADLVLIEEIIEAPKEYGLYEWLSVSTGLRYALTPVEMQSHQVKIRHAVGSENPYEALLEIEESLYKEHRCLPLFCGQEEVTKAAQVKGVQIRKSGYSDFFRLWVSDN